MALWLIIIVPVLVLLLFWSVASAGRTIESATRDKFKKDAMTGPCPWCGSPDHGKKFHSPRGYIEGLWK